jgi:hypothetical protein
MQMVSVASPLVLQLLALARLGGAILTWREVELVIDRPVVCPHLDTVVRSRLYIPVLGFDNISW